MDLYVRVVQRSLNPVEFDEDDLYAFQAFDRAQNSGHQELRDIATRLQALRQERMENAVTSTAKLGSTYKMQQLTPVAPEPGEDFAAAMAAAAEAAITGTHKIVASKDDATITATPEAAAAALAEELDFSMTLSAAAEAAISGKHSILSVFEPGVSPMPAPAPTSGAADDAQAAEAAAAERRSGAARLSPKDLKGLLIMQRLYREHFDRPLDIAEFMLNDYYGRAVLEEARGSPSHQLAELAYRYLDETGAALVHRRFYPRRPADGPAAPEIQTVTLACTGKTQVLGDFRGLGTFCLVTNAEFSTTVAVGIKGIQQALLAPGFAIACRTSKVRVKGLKGAVVELSFVGVRELVVEPDEQPKP